MLFTPRLFVLNGIAGRDTLRKPALIGQNVCIVPRAECSFRRMRLAGRGADAKKAAVLKARNEALANEDGIKIVVDSANSGAANGQTLASVWGYQKSIVHRGRYLPETLAQTPHEGGARLVRGLSGFEGQVWHQSNLIASRWWALEPSNSDWNVFMRAAGESLLAMGEDAVAESCPTASEVPWRDDLPVIEIDRIRLLNIFSPAKLGLTAALLGGCFALYTAGQYTRKSLALSKVISQTAELRVETEQIQSERRRALTNMNFVKRYRLLGDNGTVLASFSAISNVLGTTDLGIERASLRGGALELRLNGKDEVSVPDVVTLLEAEPNFSNVSAALDGGNAIVIKANVSALTKTANEEASASSSNPEMDKQPQ